MELKRNMRVKTKLGIGELLYIDSETYSLSLYIIKLIEGVHEGCKIAITRGEFSIIK